MEYTSKHQNPIAKFFKKVGMHEAAQTILTCPEYDHEIALAMRDASTRTNIPLSPPALLDAVRRYETRHYPIFKECQTAVADAGYANTAVLAEIDKRGTTVIVPSQRQALHEQEKPFNKTCFRYDEEKDCYYCPEGHILKYDGTELERNQLHYRMTSSSICRLCKHYGICTKSKHGRSITRLMNEKIKQKLEHQYKDPLMQKIYARRKMAVEHPFGHIKHNLGIRHFLIRGRSGAQAEVAIGAACFNIARMITIFGGVQGFIRTVQG